MAHATIKLTGTYEALDGGPDRGKVYIRATSDPILDTGSVVLSGLLEIDLDISGHFEVDLPATDDINLVPTNFGYKFWSRLEGNGNSPYRFFALPTASGPVVDISEIIPTDPSTFEPGVDYATAGELAAVAAARQATQDELDAEEAARIAAEAGLQAQIDAMGVGLAFGFYFPEDPAYGAVADGVTDDTAALQACIDAAAANKGGLCMFLGRYAWKGTLKQKGGVTVMGAGGPQLGSPAGSELGLQAIDGTAKYQWGGLNDGSGSMNDNPGPILNLCIDGKTVGGATELFRAEAVETSLFNVHIINGSGNAINWTQSQNINVYNPTIGGFPNGCCWLLKAGTAGLQPPGHIICYGGHIGDSKSCFNSTSWDATFFVGPHDNQFWGTIFETGRTAGLGIDSIGHVEDGDLHLFGCVLTIGAQVTAIADNATVLVKNDIRTIGTSTLVLSNCSLGGGAGAVKAAHAVRIKGDPTHVSNTVYYFGRTTVANVTYMHCHDTSDGLVQVEGPVLFVTAVTDQFTTINGGALAGVLAKTRVPRRFESISGMGSPIQVRMSTDTVANRFQVSGLGVLSWLDGAAGAIRGSITRVLLGTAHIMTLGGTWFFNGGIGKTATITTLAADGAVVIDALATSTHTITFTVNGADATSVTVNNAYEGAIMEIGFFGVVGGVNTITWDTTLFVAADPAVPLLQPAPGVLHWEQFQFLTGKWREKARI